MFRIITSKIRKNVVKNNLIQRRQLSTGNNQFSSNQFNYSSMIGVGAVTFGFFFAYNQVSASSDSATDFKKVREDITELLNNENAKNPSVDGESNGGGGAIAPMLLRLAWHCSGTWCKSSNNGGSEGATMRFKPECDHGGNAGLGIARGLLEPIKVKYPNITYADLYILAGVVAVEEMGGPKVGFRSGRSDAPKATTPEEDPRFSPDGRLPDGDKDAQHIRDIFYRMGFDDKGIVALSGAHAVGRCHTDRSGFWGPWTRADTTFSNEYYRLMLEEKWTQKKTHNGHKWEGPPQFENPEGDLMMLSTDLALVKDEKFRLYVEKYAKDEDLFFNDFAKYYQELNELGCTNLKSEKKWFEIWK